MKFKSRYCQFEGGIIGTEYGPERSIGFFYQDAPAPAILFGWSVFASFVATRKTRET